MMLEKYRRIYDNLGEFVAHVEKHSDRKAGASHRKGMEEWAGGTFEDACRIAREGWPEGHDNINKATRALLQRVVQRIPISETVFRDCPTVNVIDMSRLMEGDPECWIEQTDTEVVGVGASQKTCRIVANICTSSGISTHVIFTRGAAIVALAEALELCGRSVEITVVNTVTPGYAESPIAETRVMCKPFHARSNWHVLAFMLAHPAAQRRLIFGAEETFDVDVRSLFGFNQYGGYGHPCNPTMDTGDIYLPAAHINADQWRTSQKAEQWVIEQLINQGVAIE